MNIEEVNRTYNHIILSEVKKHLHVNSNYDDDNDYLIGLIAVATTIVENDIENNIALANKIAIMGINNKNEITIPDGNLNTISGITINGVIVSTYTVYSDEFSFTITFDDVVTGELEIEYSAGFTAQDLKPVLKQCILIKIMDMYDNERSSYTGGAFTINRAYENMINYYKKIVFI